MRALRSAPLLAAIAASALLAACQREAAPPPAASAPAAAAAKPAATDADALQAAAEALMKQQYGAGFDPTQRCWKFHAKVADSVDDDYCMRAGEPQLVDLQGQPRLYLAAHNLANAQGYVYGHVSSGLMGAFVLGPDGRGGWTLLAGDKQIPAGSSGDCSCDDAQLVRIGADAMAWKFASGGTGQGITVSRYHLIAPLGGGIRDLSALPQIAEDEQDSEYSFVIDDSDTGRPFFPLRVTKRTQQPGGNSVQTEQTVAFDPVRQVYALPGTK